MELIDRPTSLISGRTKEPWLKNEKKDEISTESEAAPGFPDWLSRLFRVRYLVRKLHPSLYNSSWRQVDEIRFGGKFGNNSLRK